MGEFGNGWHGNLEQTPSATHDKFEGEWKYRVVCGNGCFDGKYSRMCKTVKHPERYLCAKCGETLYRMDENGDE